MTGLPFLPDWPLTLSYPLLFGVLLVAGMLGGEAARQLRLPRIIGYVIVGFAIAPVAAAMNIGPLLDEARIFVDIALGLVLFDLGRRMDLGWLKRDWTLAASGIGESALTFGVVLATLLWLDFAPVQAGLAAAIAMATSPAVVLLVAQDTRAEGQVTDRAFTLVALNSLLASVLVTMLLASVHYEVRLDLTSAVLHPLYLFAGSLALGGAMAALAHTLARRLERSPELHFTLVVGLVVAAVGLAQVTRLSVILALLAFGMFSRNDERRHDLMATNQLVAPSASVQSLQFSTGEAFRCAASRSACASTRYVCTICSVVCPNAICSSNTLPPLRRKFTANVWRNLCG